MTSSNKNISALVALCEENPPISSRLLSQMPITRSFDVFFDLRQNKRLSKQLRRRWFKTSSRSLWSHCNVLSQTLTYRRFSSTAVDISACMMNYNLLFYENVTYSCRELVDLTSSVNTWSKRPNMLIFTISYRHKFRPDQMQTRMLKQESFLHL